jgi:hypothetical protein
MSVQNKRRRVDKNWEELMKFREEFKTNVYPQLLLKITYDVQHETHTGYCSDLDDDIEVIHRTCSEVVGLPVAFRKKDICVNGVLQSSIPTDNQLLIRLFAKSPKKCDKGSGNCGCQTTYHIRSANIVVQKSVSNLELPIETSDII